MSISIKGLEEIAQREHNDIKSNVVIVRNIDNNIDCVGFIDDEQIAIINSDNDDCIIIREFDNISIGCYDMYNEWVIVAEADIDINIKNLYNIL